MGRPQCRPKRAPAVKRRTRRLPVTSSAKSWLSPAAPLRREPGSQIFDCLDGGAGLLGRNSVAAQVF